MLSTDAEYHGNLESTLFCRSLSPVIPSTPLIKSERAPTPMGTVFVNGWSRLLSRNLHALSPVSGYIKTLKWAAPKFTISEGSEPIGATTLTSIPRFWSTFSNSSTSSLCRNPRAVGPIKLQLIFFVRGCGEANFFTI